MDIYKQYSDCFENANYCQEQYRKILFSTAFLPGIYDFGFPFRFEVPIIDMHEIFYVEYKKYRGMFLEGLEPSIFGS